MVLTLESPMIVTFQSKGEVTRATFLLTLLHYKLARDVARILPRTWPTHHATKCTVTS